MPREITFTGAANLKRFSKVTFKRTPVHMRHFVKNIPTFESRDPAGSVVGISVEVSKKAR